MSDDSTPRDESPETRSESETPVFVRVADGEGVPLRPDSPLVDLRRCECWRREDHPCDAVLIWGTPGIEPIEPAYRWLYRTPDGRWLRVVVYDDDDDFRHVADDAPCGLVDLAHVRKYAWWVDERVVAGWIADDPTTAHPTLKRLLAGGWLLSPEKRASVLAKYDATDAPAAASSGVPAPDEPPTVDHAATASAPRAFDATEAPAAIDYDAIAAELTARNQEMSALLVAHMKDRAELKLIDAANVWHGTKVTRNAVSQRLSRANAALAAMEAPIQFRLRGKVITKLTTSA